VLVLVACGGGGTPIVNHAGPATKPAPCPRSYDELTPVVQSAWGAGAQVDLCLPLVRGGKALWWLEGHADAPPNTMHEVPVRRALLDGHTIVWIGNDEHGMGYGYMYGPPSNFVSTGDLDGDGNDEVLYERQTGEGGMSQTNLVIVYFEPAPVAMEISLGWSQAAEEQQSCSGTWSLVAGTGRAKRIAIERSGNACEPKERRETFERRGATFEPI